jgi:Domain of Kin17 curved DNA-binding protein
MACRHPNVRIEAHKVYNEFIQDKHHIHMNSTTWLTLTEYVKYLGREGMCTVEETEKGWFIRLIHRDPQQVCCCTDWATCEFRWQESTSRCRSGRRMCLYLVTSNGMHACTSAWFVPCRKL